MLLERTIYRCSKLFSILAQVAQIMANKGQLCLLRVNAFNLADAFDCLVLKNIAAQTVNSIGWVNDYSAVFEVLCYLLY